MWQIARLCVWCIRRYHCCYYTAWLFELSSKARNQTWNTFQYPAAKPTGRYTSSLPILSSSYFFLAILEYKMSIGWAVSYKLGASRIIKAVPRIQAIVKIQRNSRSNTMATYFQSSSTWKYKILYSKWNSKRND